MVHILTINGKRAVENQLLYGPTLKNKLSIILGLAEILFYFVQPITLKKLPREGSTCASVGITITKTSLVSDILASPHLPSSLTHSIKLKK